MLDHVVEKCPNGVDTYLGREFSDQSVALSGGEAQSVAVARAFYKDSPIVLFDEPTAALDPVTAKNVMRLFTELAGECALVVVSHDHRLVEENGFRCLRLDVDGGDGSINTTLRG